MRSKLDTSLAELHKIRNQIRVELNRIRPRGQIITLEKKEHSAKRIFNKKFQPTDIVNPSAEKSQQETNKHGKRIIDSQSIHFSESSHSTERKHFGRYYTDSVSLQYKIRRTASPYFAIKTNSTPPPSPNKYESTSLYGIGLNDKSHNLSYSRPCIRVYNNRQTTIF